METQIKPKPPGGNAPLEKISKSRLDSLLVERQLADTKNKAQALIMAGLVYVKGQKVDKPGVSYPSDVEITIQQKTHNFVSRGGEKIDAVFDYFKIDLSSLICADIGASTGGFTDCMLQRGAELVYAIDVGTGQLHQKIREDKRVIVYEKIHAKNLTPEYFNQGTPTFVTFDLSFISLTKVVDFVFACLSPSFSGLLLVKPQFELEAKDVSKGGVVKEALHQKAIDKVSTYLTARGIQVKGVEKAALKGDRKGNQEYFIYVVRG